jgi:GNAT superfamily N-acetyltransferase
MADLWMQLARYRKVKVLPDGTKLLLRPLEKTEEDKQGLVDLFARAPKEDLEYFRHDAADPTVVAHWVDNLLLQRVYPLVAVVDGKIVGDFTLHFGERFHRHLAWVRLFIDQDFRGLGIGTLMLCALIDIARLLGLQFLYIEVVTSQYRVIKAVEGLGFHHAVTLPDYFITSANQTLDMGIYVLDLVGRTNSF